MYVASAEFLFGQKKTNAMNKIYNPVAGYDVFYQPYMDGVPQDGNRLQPLKISWKRPAAW
jgi:hypothetical protein